MDLYQLLGLTRGASASDIERAYRRLSRRYHPGVNPGDRVAEEMFRQIQQAYEVLADFGRRNEYDRRGRAVPGAVDSIEATVLFDGFDFSAPAEGPRAATFSELFADVFQDAAREATMPTRGADIDATLVVSFRNAVGGGAFPLSVVRRERCPSCSGDGYVARPPATCPACGGEGARRWARGHMVFTKPCEDCGGEGRVAVQACRPCGGAGVLTRSEVVTVALPPGVESGTRVSVPGRGHAGARGGPAGDLYVMVDVLPHPFFRRAGPHVSITVPLAIHEAALGAGIDVPTLDGTVRVKIPPGTASGDRLRVSGHGVPPAAGAADPGGDLVIDVQIVVPSEMDERSKDLLREFGRLNATDVRRHLFST